MKLHVLSDKPQEFESLLALLQSPHLNERGMHPHYEIRTLQLSANTQPFAQEGRDPILFLSSLDTSAELIKKFLQAHTEPCLVILSARVPSYLFTLLEEKKLSPNQVFLIGARSFAPEDAVLLKRIRTLSPSVFLEEGIAEVAFSLMEALRTWKSVYVSINLDVVDPAFAPGVDQPAPGGFTSRELVYLLQKLKLVNTIKTYGLVGYSQEKDRDALTQRLSAHILATLS